MSYTPIDDSILRSSILLEDVATRWLWTVMLLLADQTRDSGGVVDCPTERLAQIANLTVEQTRHAIDRLSSPDERSSTKDQEGRRIVACENVEGFEPRKWRLVNWEKYKAEIRKAQVAAAARRYRDSKRIEAPSRRGIKRHQPSSDRHSPTPSPTPSPKEEKRGTRIPPTYEEILAEAERRGYASPEKLATRFDTYYTSNGWKVGKNQMKNWIAALVGWATREA